MESKTIEDDDILSIGVNEDSQLEAEENEDQIQVRKIGNPVINRSKRQWADKDKKCFSSEVVSSQTLKDIVPDVKEALCENDTGNGN